MLTLASLSASLASLLGAAAQFAPEKNLFWDNIVFSKDSWTQVMNVVRIGLTLGGALLFIYALRARKLGVPVKERTQRRVAIVFTALAFAAYFDFFNPNSRYPEYYHRHELFHYYLGSKYFDEIGYTRLYECAAVAEVDLGRGSQVKNRELRDLRVNLIKPMKDTYVLDRPEECKKHFTAERWAAWKKDIDWFYRSAAGTYWENMQKDHGYNPPPVWTMTGKFFASFGMADDKPFGIEFFKILASLDILFHLGAVLLIGWAFGWKVMAVAAVFWGCNAPANFYWTGGAFMRQDWIFLLVASVCFARKRHYVLSGAALTWSALLRVFPLILFAGWAVIIGIHIVRQLQRRRAHLQLSPRNQLETVDPIRRASYRTDAEVGKSARLPPRPRAMKGLFELLHPSHRQLISGCIIAIGVLVPISVAVAGPDSYVEFVHHIGVHKNTPLTNHMGLETILVHNWEGRMRFLRDDNMDDPFEGWKQGRLDRFKALQPLFLSITALIFLWLVWDLRRTKLLWVGIPLSLPLVVCLTNLTCYYYSMFMVAAVLIRARPGLAPVMLATSGASQILLINYYWVDDKFTAQAWLFWIFGLLFMYAYARPLSRERLKAWLRDEPEPRPAPPAVTQPAE